MISPRHANFIENAGGATLARLPRADGRGAAARARALRLRARARGAVPRPARLAAAVGKRRRGGEVSRRGTPDEADRGGRGASSARPRDDRPPALSAVGPLAARGPRDRAPRRARLCRSARDIGLRGADDRRPRRDAPTRAEARAALAGELGTSLLKIGRGDGRREARRRLERPQLHVRPRLSEHAACGRPPRASGAGAPRRAGTPTSSRRRAAY